ncbi:MAG: DUF547 domain-containing protein [Candidatus Hydrogenedentes bacterium]|nr:DUF547 domain-containing protein [Candidatus Hydrogenedentota bacterium]
MTRYLSAAMVLVLSALAPLAVAADFDHSHGAFSAVLGAQVHDGAVSYAALKAAPEDLNAYLGSLSAVPKADYDGWTKDRQLAFLMNAYNAFTLKLIVENYPLASIRDLSGPWSREFVPLLGATISLDTIEHEMIRKPFNEPRIHFALVCAAKSCPPLRSEAYVAERLDAQLTEQAKTFLAQTEKNKLDLAKKTLYLSPIFKWYKEDFVKQASGLAVFCAPFLPEAPPATLDVASLKVRYTDYDWSLNEKVTP